LQNSVTILSVKAVEDDGAEVGIELVLEKEQETDLTFSVFSCCVLSDKTA